jgi:DNA-binding transcriptional LysR family regulator
MDLDLRVVRSFVTVAEELHFGRAAARLFVSQPALSKQIQKLELQLGASLFVRNSRQVGLTARGEAFLLDARELLRLAERMQAPQDASQVRIAHAASGAARQPTRRGDRPSHTRDAGGKPERLVAHVAATRADATSRPGS